MSDEEVVRDEEKLRDWLKRGAQPEYQHLRPDPFIEAEAALSRILADRDSLRAALEQEKDRYEVMREQVVDLLNDFMRQANDGITALTSSEKEKKPLDIGYEGTMTYDASEK